MNRTRLASLTLALHALALAACASAPAAEAPPDVVVAAAPNGCTEIQLELQTLEDRRRDAETRQQDAWKVFVPFIVVARYADARAAADDAARRIDALAAEASSLGCSLETPPSARSR